MLRTLSDSASEDALIVSFNLPRLPGKPSESATSALVWLSDAGAASNSGLERLALPDERGLERLALGSKADMLV